MGCSAVVLNLPDRTERWKLLNERFSSSGISLKRYENMVMVKQTCKRDNAYLGVALTQFHIIRDAKRAGLKTVLVLEDDCLPEENCFRFWETIKAWLDDNLDKWDVFNGGMYGIQSIFEKIDLEYGTLLSVYGGSFSHWMYFNVDAVYDRLIDWDGTEIDLWWPLHFRNYTCFPLLATQDKGYSDIGQYQKDWSDFFLKAKINTALLIENC